MAVATATAESESESDSGNKMICTICFEELKPIAEELQAVSVCGHVFHELCLQQWFEYSASKSKHRCPICKQSCSGNKVCRLYFQSTGNVDDEILSQKPTSRAEDPESLLREVLRLEAKVSGLSSTLDRQGKDLKELTSELCQCKDTVKAESALKDEAIKQKTAIQQLLHLKSQELDKSNLECLRLHDKNMALAKELAALKLVSDLDLGKDEVLKLASLGNTSNTKQTIDTLTEALAVRNKMYKELMARCGALGRGEARYSKKLEEAEEKIRKLKVQIQELEKAFETKDNDQLRALKASRKKHPKGPSEENVKSPAVKNFHIEGQPVQISNLEKAGIARMSHSPTLAEDSKSKKEPDALRPPTSFAATRSENPINVVDVDALDVPAADQGYRYNLNRQSSETIAAKDNGMPLSGLSKSSNVNGKTSLTGASTTGCTILGSKTCSNLTGNSTAAIDDDDVVFLGAPPPRPVLNIRKETPPEIPLFKPGDICFTGGLLGPDGTNRYLGKWCKRAHNNTSNATQSAGNSSLIAVGSDGKGGRIKVLRPSSLSSDDKENSAKRSRTGSKTMSQGCLQIDNFFQKANHN